ncbi:MAG TPA: pyrroloquinoline quinone biosynthesis peptide chaperone PqqD [Terriglobales bacterium]|nr:pyrroloquinoline quinone biosynthesis peptide chaperone PqqD [Terriglobales bacterium]
MALPADHSQPQLAKGCRWGEEGADDTILFPEGVIKVQGTGKHILERCDGQNTFADIVDELQKHYSNSDPAKIRDDVGKFLEALQQKRIVDY